MFADAGLALAGSRKQMDEDTSGLLDSLMADGFLFFAFMIHMSLELACTKSDPQAWTREFISKLHSAMDNNENMMGQEGQRLPIHELARLRVDQFSRNLQLALQRRNQSP
jgi:hypothetical protein